MGLKSLGRKTVDEYDYGIWVWQCEDGEVLGDGDGNIMNVPGLRNDREAQEKITKAAKYYGFPDGKPVFWQGKRRITDEEYEEQQARAKLGLVPDPLDTGAIMDELRYNKYYGN
jgi:hypothetical protein